MIDFIVNTVAEVVDFFINFYTDKIIDKFANISCHFTQNNL